MEYFIKKIIKEAGKIVLEGHGNIKDIEVKDKAGLVTDVDKRSEEFLINSILEKYPQSSILAEESGEKQKKGKFKWIIDPIDGTSNFAHGFPWFCISIGVEIDGELAFGAIYNPLLDELFFAEKRKSAFLNDKQIKVSQVLKLEDSLVATGFSYLKGKPLENEMKRFSQVEQIALGVRRAGSAALDFAQVACGRFSGFWEHGLSPWDVAAGFLIVEEAGGRFTNYMGQAVSIYDKDFVVSNGKIHAELIETIKI
jgi:myo-inositol-1(or 4)-monophosphatase